MKILLILILSILSAIFYRMGGSGRWNTKARDFGCALVALASLYICGVRGPWWAFLASFGLLFGALTTYWKFGSPDGKWWNWLLTGFFYGLAFMPFYTLWPKVLIRSVVLAVATMAWSEKIDNDILEELGRGFLLNSTILLFLAF